MLPSYSAQQLVSFLEENLIGHFRWGFPFTLTLHLILRNFVCLSGFDKGYDLGILVFLLPSDLRRRFPDQ
ncbi:hypothetical protein DOT_3643 [Desulfosporosinus sp. OT]|nr:hypothetical protein DOT_3643 [Desulfosporosinus sp. OT]